MRPFAPEQLPDLRRDLRAGWEKWAVAGAPKNASDFAIEAERANIQISLRDSSLWWVGAEMCELLYGTMRAIPEDVRVENLNIPGKFGLVMLAKPWEATDAIAGTDLVVDAFQWVQAKIGPNETPALSIEAYRYFTYSDELLRSLKSVGNRVGYEYGTRGEWLPLGRSDWPLGHDLNEPWREYLDSDQGEFETAFRQSSQEDRRILAALFSLLDSQSLTRIDQTKPSRQQVRQAQRKGTAVPSKVNVVYLRRPAQPTRSDGESQEHHLSHRFVVRAHPRMQACGPNHSERKLIMVNPYVKGPADAPLVVKETVNAWVR